MRRTAVAAAVAVVALLALLLWLRSPAGEEGGGAPHTPARVAPGAPATPSVAAPATAPVPEPPAPAAAEAAVPPAADTPSSRVHLVVETNVPGAKVTLRRRMRGGDPDPPPEAAIVGKDLKASFPLGDALADYVGLDVEVGAKGYVTVFSGTGPAHLEMGVGLRPARGVALRGIVLGADGRPVAGADVSRQGWVSARSDEEGSFEMWGNEGPAELAAKAPGYVETKVEVEAPSDGVEIRLSRGLAVSGRVSFPDGRPAGGIVVNAGDEEGRTDASGAYIVHGLRAGTVQVQAEPSDECREVEAGASGVDFVLARHVALVRMVDGQGRPFRWPRYVAQQWKRGEPIPPPGFGPSQAGPSGIITWPLEEGETLRIAPMELGFVCPSATIVAEGPPALHEVTIPVVRPFRMATLLLRVRNDSDEPPPHVQLEARDEMGTLVPGVTGGDRVELSPEGTARVEGIVPGKYRVTVVEGLAAFDEGWYGLPATREVVLEGGQATAAEFVLGKGGRLTVVVRVSGGPAPAFEGLRLLDDRGEPVDVEFGIVRPGESFSPSVAAGSLLVSDRALPAGRYTVEALRAEKVIGSAVVSVVPREMARAEVRLGE